jgi:putative pyruvate formate lyase activating enzyme
MHSISYPSYRRLLTAGGFDEIISRADPHLLNCDLCPRLCAVDRSAGERGFCRGGSLPRVSSFGPHFGEESPLVGRYGSGTIFFAGCNLRCCFCQNYDISHSDEGRETSIEQLASLMVRLERGGCHNINFVTPTHYVPQIISATRTAAEEGLSVPIVYNCGGYENLETLKLLEGIVDIYMPDFKFSSEANAARYCDAPDYPDVVRAALKEMHGQVGNLVIKDGIARRGLLVRHLVMPGRLDDSKGVFEFLAAEISQETFVNVMDQYRPCYEADHYPEIARRLSADEFRSALALAGEAGLARVYC